MDSENEIRLNQVLPPGGQRRVEICEPLPRFAGTYAGAIELTANGQRTERVSLALSTRGPSFGQQGLLVLPLFLFVFTLVAAFAISARLEDWFTRGGLAYAESMVALARISSALHEARADIAGLPLPRVKQTLQIDATSAEAIRRNQRSVPDVSGEILRLTCHLQAAQFLVVALGAIAPPVRDAAATKVDALALPATADELKNYNQAVEAEVAPPSAALSGASLSGAQIPAAVAGPEPDPEEHRRAILRMERLQRGLLWLTAATTAYSTFYLNNPAFGSAVDYLNLFAWALGLTQAGAQILSQARMRQ